MKQYRVRWEIDIDAKNEVEASKMAREIQLDPNSTATIFEVSEVQGKFIGLAEKVDLAFY